MEIKDTLLMPKTKYPMKGNLTNKEPEIEKKWNEEKIYDRIIKKNEKKETFFLHDGPPYANGDLHLGHALNKILKDFIIRSKNMSGFKTEVILGWDTHGLPIENALLKNKKVKVKDLSTNEFRNKCQEYARNQVDNQKEQFFRLGILAKKDQYYVTYDKKYEAEQIRVFAKMIEKDMIFKGLKPVYWSPTSQTALAEAEIEYIDKKSPAIYVTFETKYKEYTDLKSVIWTTTPWTIPANQGIAVGENIEYSIIDSSKGKFLIASKLVEDFIQNIELENVSTIETVFGKNLENTKIIHPLNKKEFIIMLANHVTDESGTGCVHTAPGHGEDDFIVGKKYKLETLSVVDSNGIMTQTGKYDGVFYEDAQKLITDDLKDSGSLLSLTFITHSYPHDWRTKKPIIFRATWQWFASISKDKDGMLDAIKNVDWINKWGEKRLHNMIKDREDWCISRQRKWGVPIPIIYTEKKTPIFDQKVLAHISNLFEQKGSNIWFELEAKDLLPESYKNELSPNGIFTKETDIMDVWFDSGVSHSAVMKNKLNTYQSDLYLEGSDQYRGWFNSSLITGFITQGKAPYKSILSHGFVLDGKGNKMSKSIGNIVSPKQIYQKYGADILRLWVSNVDYQSDVRYTEENIKQITEIYRRFRNSFRFILGNLEDGTTFSKNDCIEFEKLSKVDKYVLIKLDNLNQKIQKYYQTYDFKKIIDEVNEFITNLLSSFYFDFIKDILYIQDIDSSERRAVQTVLYTVFNTLIPLLAPIIPHTADETWNYLHEEPVFLVDFPEIQNLKDETIQKEVEVIIELRNTVNKSIEIKREEKIIGKSFEAEIEIFITNKEYEFLKSCKNLSLYLIVSNIKFVDNNENFSTTSEKYSNFEIGIKKYSELNCIRCWKYYLDNELNSERLCENCSNTIEKIKGKN